jgi:hypothetical protein
MMVASAPSLTVTVVGDESVDTGLPVLLETAQMPTPAPETPPTNAPIASAAITPTGAERRVKLSPSAVGRGASSASRAWGCGGVGGCGAVAVDSTGVGGACGGVGAWPGSGCSGVGLEGASVKGCSFQADSSIHAEPVGWIRTRCAPAT